jgi:hypothetical protein
VGDEVGGGGGRGAGESGEGAEPGPRNSVPFEDRSLPFFTRLSQTAGRAFSDPMRLFSAMPSGDIGPPLLYGVLVNTVAIVFLVLWQMTFGSLAMLADSASAEEVMFSTWVMVVCMVFSPLLAAVALFIQTGIYHLVLLLLGDGQRGFPITFRAVAYGSTPQLLAVIPFCGELVGGVWNIILEIIGASQGHGTEWWRALLAYFLPTILCCCLAVWALMSLGFLGALAG